ncbi:SOS response-associated peptidase [Planctomicrobium piriforme]|uniref:Abasic site processing protein n=1 Tax=Planctomicrobium piriforme TaxID=1576369 RepID=A0A1I3R9W4_9PLAN|nr:SOS response-associated peptidase [Planctomicrobium piriforme]SFJ42459.1 Putative SOS response-associated peptidase YedK [Planctomicrobium piriforme]
MCGRFNLQATPVQLKEIFDLLRADDFPQRYNIARTQTVPIVRLDPESNRELVPMRWGLIPGWAKDIKIGASLINARGETVAEKPSFRTAFKRHRCLVPASGFYEWLREGKDMKPFYIHRTDDQPFAMAGLWERWNQSGEPIESFSIITTSANSLMSSIHDRMPVLVEPNLFEAWLDPKAEPEFLKGLVQPQEWNGFELVPVSTVVNNARNDTPECVQALTTQG